MEEPSLAELARVINAGLCIEASFKRGKGEAGMDEYQVRTWQGWHHHMAHAALSSDAQASTSAGRAAHALVVGVRRCNGPHPWRRFADTPMCYVL